MRLYFHLDSCDVEFDIKVKKFTFALLSKRK